MLPAVHGKAASKRRCSSVKLSSVRPSCSLRIPVIALLSSDRQEWGKPDAPSGMNLVDAVVQKALIVSTCRVSLSLRLPSIPTQQRAQCDVRPMGILSLGLGETSWQRSTSGFEQSQMARQQTLPAAISKCSDPFTAKSLALPSPFPCWQRCTA